VEIRHYHADFDRCPDDDRLRDTDWGVQKFYSDAFFDRMKDVFNKQMYTALQKKLTEDDPVGQLEIVLDAYQGQLGIDTDTRNYYILDDTGAVLATSAADTDKNIEMTPNLLTALTGGDGYTGRSNAEYMDVAVPIKDRAGDTAYVVYILDNKQDVHRLNRELITIILEAVLIGVAISAVLSFIISKPLLQPIVGMTKAAEAMAGGTSPARSTWTPTMRSAYWPGRSTTWP
jgi:two-component system sensor histidine kinase VicK